VDLVAYTTSLVERFANPEVRDTLARLATDGSDRIPKFLLPVVRENLRSGGPVRLSAAVVASWARYAEGVDEEGNSYPVADRLADSLTAAAGDQRQDRQAFLRQRELFGDLVDEPRFTQAYTAALELLISRGAHATVATLVPAPAEGRPAGDASGRPR
jgi:mannitol 2-dehydrogenase